MIHLVTQYLFFTLQVLSGESTPSCLNNSKLEQDPEFFNFETNGKETNQIPHPLMDISEFTIQADVTPHSCDKGESANCVRNDQSANGEPKDQEKFAAGEAVCQEERDGANTLVIMTVLINDIVL